MNATAAPPKKLVGVNRSANQAFSSYVQGRHLESALAAKPSQDVVQISIECEESDIITDSGSETYFAMVRIFQSIPALTELSVEGPRRNGKQEAVRDGELLQKVYYIEGESGARRAAQRLEQKIWSTKEMENGVETSLDNFLSSVALSARQEKLIPPGEGWIRASDEMLKDPRSQVHFVQSGESMGKYMVKDPESNKWQEVLPPHSPVDFPLAIRAGGANIVRKGAKLERTVMLNELPKISRLALKFPLSFVDSPSSAFAIFSGFRSTEAADWCAKNFHTKLIPQLATKIHKWETKELQTVLKSVLQELDAEILKSSHAFSGCSAAIALMLGDRLVVSGVGQVRAVILSEGGAARQLLSCTSNFQAHSDERKRAEEAGGFVHCETLHRSTKLLEDLNEAQRILGARHAFEVLQLEEGGPTDEKQVRTAYKRLALKVHPDKIPEDADVESFNKAFARLEMAKESVEGIFAEDAGACRELHKVLRHEIHTREAAADLLGVSKEASTDTDQVTEEAEKAARRQEKLLEKMQAAKDYVQATAMCKEAIETLRRPSSAEALPRHEALLRQGLPTSRAIGARDFRFPSPIVLMEPETMAWHVPVDKLSRLALLCGATANLSDAQLSSSSSNLLRQPKAAALRWSLISDPVASSVGALCVTLEPKRDRRDDSGPSSAKRQRTASSSQQQVGCVFLRHILFRHQLLKSVDPMARREGACKGPSEAEAKALQTLEQLLAKPGDFIKLCRELSDCTTGTQPGQLVGHLGWIGKGEQEPAFEEAAFALEVQEFSDIITTSRGVHVLQRLG